jgi:hypothetical protein
MADISKNSFDPTKDYRKVIYQRDRPVLDFELNESQDIQRFQQGWLVQYANGDFYLGDGFLVHPVDSPELRGNRVAVRHGSVVHMGRRVPLEADYTIGDDDSPLTTPVGEDREDIVYVKYFEEEVTSVDDPNIVDPEFGQETAIRLRVRALVRVEEGGQIPCPALGETVFEIARLHRRSGVTAITADQIEDTRPQSLHNFVVGGLHVRKSAGTGAPFRFAISNGRARVADEDVSFDFSSTSPATFEVGPNATTFVLVSRDGNIVLEEVTSNECCTTDIHLLLACIVSSDVGIETVTDRRLFVSSFLTWIYLKLLELEDALVAFREDPPVQEWERENSKRNYPFVQDASLDNGVLILPTDFLIDVDLANTQCNQRYYVSRVINTPNLQCIEVSQRNGVRNPVARVCNTNTIWSTLEQTIQALRFHSAVNIAGKAYIFGGLTNTDVIVGGETVLEFDLDGTSAPATRATHGDPSTGTETWPAGRFDHAALALSDSRMLVYGGRANADDAAPLPLGDMWIFTPDFGDPDGGAWRKLPTLVVASGSSFTDLRGRYGHRMLSRRVVTPAGTFEEIFIYGGHLLFDSGSMVSYEPTDEFVKVTLDITPVNDGGSVRPRDEVVSVELLDGSPPGRRSWHGMTLTGNRLYVMGGENSAAQTLNDLWEFNPPNTQWTRLEPSDAMLPPVRFGHQMFQTPGAVYVWGGKNSFGSLSDVWRFGLDARRWEKRTSSPVALQHAASVTRDDARLVAFAGQSGWTESRQILTYVIDEIPDSDFITLNDSCVCGSAILDMTRIPLNTDEDYTYRQTALLPTVAHPRLPEECFPCDVSQQGQELCCEDGRVFAMVRGNSTLHGPLEIPLENPNCQVLCAVVAHANGSADCAAFPCRPYDYDYDYEYPGPGPTCGCVFVRVGRKECGKFYVEYDVTYAAPQPAGDEAEVLVELNWMINGQPCAVPVEQLSPRALIDIKSSKEFTFCGDGVDNSGRPVRYVWEIYNDATGVLLDRFEPAADQPEDYYRVLSYKFAFAGTFRVRLMVQFRDDDIAVRDTIVDVE